MHICASAFSWFACLIGMSRAHRLEEVELTGKAVAAVTRFSRDEGHAVRLAAARAAGHLALAELHGKLPEDAALAPLVSVMVALIGTDQSSEVQRQMLLVRGLDWKAM